MPKYKLSLMRTQYREVEVEADSYDAAQDAVLDMDRTDREQWKSLWAANQLDDIEVSLLSEETN